MVLQRLAVFPGSVEEHSALMAFLDLMEEVHAFESVARVGSTWVLQERKQQDGAVLFYKRLPRP
jgi:hypothetical protein